MGSFADVVLDAGVALKGPLQKDFSVADWTRNWKENRTDEVDDRLFRSGLWIGARWSALHGYKADLERTVAPLNPKQQVLAWLNEQIGKQIRQGSEYVKLLASSGEAMSISNLTRAPNYEHLPRDALIIILGDAMQRVVEDYGYEIANDYIPNTHLIPSLGRVFINLTQLVHRWEECKRLGCWFEEKDHVSIFLNPNSDYSASEAVAFDRRAHHEFWICVEPVSQVSRLRANLPVVSRASLSGGKLSCHLERPTNSTIKAEQHFARLVTSRLRRAAELETPEAVRNLPLRAYGDLKIAELLDAFEVLASLATIVTFRELEINDHLVPMIQESLPRFAIRDLVDLLHRAIGFSAEKARSVLNVFTYQKGARDGAWSAPLLPAGPDHVELSALMGWTHPSRLVEHWVLRGGQNEGKRGRIYEKFVRKLIKIAADENPLLRRKVEVCSSNVQIDVGSDHRDVDLLVRIENAVLVGEIKSTARPLMPWEQRVYMKDVLETAPRQLELRMEAIKNVEQNRKVIARHLKFSGDVNDILWVPAVVTVQYEGAGCHIRGIPIVDYHLLLDFFMSNTYEFGFARHAGVDVAENSILLYSDSASAAGRLQAYLNSPPAVVGRYPLISNNPIRGEDVLPGTGNEIWSEQKFVRSYTASDIKKSADLLRQRWSAAVTEKAHPDAKEINAAFI
jgi:hypothetical protein